MRRLLKGGTRGESTFKMVVYPRGEFLSAHFAAPFLPAAATGPSLLPPLMRLLLRSDLMLGYVNPWSLKVLLHGVLVMSVREMAGKVSRVWNYWIGRTPFMICQ